MDSRKRKRDGVRGGEIVGKGSQVRANEAGGDGTSGCRRACRLLAHSEARGLCESDLQVIFQHF